MNYRIQQFLAAENITQAQLADTLGVARASVSHIIAGRNKPGFDFIESMARNFPTLNLDWLITGRGRMYKDAAASAAAIPVQQASPLPEAPVSPAESEYDEPGDDLFASIKPATEPVKPSVAPSQPAPAPAPQAPQSPHIQPQAPLPRPQAVPTVPRGHGIAKILVLFEDGSFQELK